MKRILITCNKKPVSISMDQLEAITTHKFRGREASPVFALVLRTASGMDYITDEYVFTEGAAANAIAAINPEDGEAVGTLKGLLVERCIRHGIDEEGWASSRARTS